MEALVSSDTMKLREELPTLAEKSGNFGAQTLMRDRQGLLFVGESRLMLQRIRTERMPFMQRRLMCTNSETAFLAGTEHIVLSAIDRRRRAQRSANKIIILIYLQHL